MTTLLEGNISKLSLFNLLQLIKLEQKTCKMVISIKELQQEARLFFQYGLIKHAEINKLTGPDAVYRLICWWNAGEFKIEEIDESEIPYESIQHPLESMLIESAKRTDDLANLKALIPSLENKMSFSQDAIYEIQNLLNPENPDWIPGFVVELPITFSLARFFDVCPQDDLGSCNTLSYMISTGIVHPHAEQAEFQTSSAIDSLGSIVMEYLGFAQSQQIISEACESLQMSPDVKPGFNQLLQFSDYIKERIEEMLDEETAQEIEWRLRARITSLS